MNDAITEYYRDRDRGDRGRGTLPLSLRVRPDVECAPWVKAEIEKLEAALREARAAVAAPAVPEWQVGDRVMWANAWGAKFPGTIRAVETATAYGCELDDGCWAQDQPADRFTAASEGEGDANG